MGCGQLRDVIVHCVQHLGVCEGGARRRTSLGRGHELELGLAVALASSEPAAGFGLHAADPHRPAKQPLGIVWSLALGFGPNGDHGHLQQLVELVEVTAVLTQTSAKFAGEPSGDLLARLLVAEVRCTDDSIVEFHGCTIHESTSPDH